MHKFSRISQLKCSIKFAQGIVRVFDPLFLIQKSNFQQERETFFLLLFYSLQHSDGLQESINISSFSNKNWNPHIHLCVGCEQISWQNTSINA